MKVFLTGMLALALAVTTAQADTGGSSATAGLWDVGAPISDDIVIGVSEIISDVTVTVNMDHSWVGDITATISNSTTSVDLIPASLSDSSNLGIDTDGFDTLIPDFYTFSDGGATDIATASAGGFSGFEIPKTSGPRIQKTVRRCVW